MPFIDSKVTLPMTEDKKETIKAKLGQAITCLLYTSPSPRD